MAASSKPRDRACSQGRLITSAGPSRRGHPGPPPQLTPSLSGAVPAAGRPLRSPQALPSGPEVSLRSTAASQRMPTHRPSQWSAQRWPGLAAVEMRTICVCMVSGQIFVWQEATHNCQLATMHQVQHGRPAHRIISSPLTSTSVQTQRVHLNAVSEKCAFLTAPYNKHRRPPDKLHRQTALTQR